jgi:hypothetical protein
MILSNSTAPGTQGTERGPSSESKMARLGARAAQSHVAGFLAGLLMMGGLLANVDFRVAANSTEISAFTGKSAAYNTYYNARTCATCHASGFAVGGLSSLGAAFWTRLVNNYGSSRTLANEQSALGDIESADADNDGYSNLVEINANKDASSNLDTPTLSASVTATTGTNAKSGTAGATVSYTITVTNTGNKTDRFNISAIQTSGQSWSTSMTTSSPTLYLSGNPGNGTQNITVEVVISGGATNGQTSTATFTATSQNSGGVTASVTLTTTAISTPVAATRFVKASTGVNTGTCSSSGSPCKTITYAMSQAVAGDTINVEPGTYNLALGEVFPIDFKSGIQLKATGSPADTSIDATGDIVKTGIIVVSSNTAAARIEGFTIKNGLSIGTQCSGISGAGALKISSSSALFTITRNIFSANEARGVERDNTCGKSGAHANGGAIQAFSSFVSITNNLFVENIARGGNGYSDFGGGLDSNAYGGNGDGGALYIFGSGSITNNTFHNNSALGGNGGGSAGGSANGGNATNGAIAAGALAIENNIFTNNAATAGVGGTSGTASAGAVNDSSATAITKNLFFGNTVNGAASTGDTTGTGAITSDPLFVSAPTNLRITSSSPAKAAGTTGANVPSTDFDGVTRPSPPAIGAFEPIAPPTVTTSAATLVTLTTATLNGTANPNGVSTTGSFQYGTTISYGTTTTAQSLGSGSAAVSIGGGAITGLTCGTTYNFRATATSNGGTTNGSNLTFTTTACPTAPAIGSATSSSLTATTADLSGSVSSDGGATITERGFVHSVNATNANPVIGGNGVTKTTVSGTTGAMSATVPSLTSGTGYAFKAYATNSVGTTYSSVATFTTANPTVSINDVSAQEGNSSSQNYTFTASLSAASSATVTVAYATQSGTATAGSDYTTASGTLTFTAGLTTQTFMVAVSGDTTAESDETFTVVLSNASNATITKGTGTGAILNDDGGTTLPGLSIADTSAYEGHSGPHLIDFAVNLSVASATDVTVNYATSDGTATAGSDYTATSGTMTIPAGVTTKKLVVVVQGDITAEPDETVLVTLSSPTGATLVKPTATGNIVNEDPPPTATTVTQYRLYHDGTKEHLYTTDLNEYNVLGTRGWTQEGIAYKMLTAGVYGGVLTVPLFRVYHPGILQHHWTTDSNETTTLSGNPAWFYEATIGYVVPSQVAGTVPLYRMALASPPIHVWTTDLNEYETLATRGWTKEGIIGYVVP